MPTESKCPFCERPITMWAVMRAPLPSSIRCEHCRQKIRVRDVSIYLLGYLFIAAILAGALVIARHQGRISAGVEIAVVVIGLLLLEVVMSFLVLRRARFTKPGA